MPDTRVLISVESDFEDRVDRALLTQSVQTAVDLGREGAIGQGDLPEHRWERAEVSVRVTDDSAIHRLNREYRGVDRPTDVLSFSFVEGGPPSGLPADEPLPLGEIVLSYPYAERQAVELGHPTGTELAWLAAHGTLQLLGYTHETDERAERMEALEQRVLKALGIRMS